MFKCLFSRKVINNNNTQNKNPPIKEKDKKKELSPKSMKKAISTENFMKFQWSWTL